MALHPDFPKDPYAILDPEVRWFPAEETLRDGGYEKLLPPLVPRLRKLVKEWRDNGYSGASQTTKALLRWWFIEEHNIWDSKGFAKQFRYYFAQREAIETAIYLAEVVGVREPVDLLQYDSSGRLSTGMFVEDWPRLVLKLATGSGKTKVLSLLIAWSYFHRVYEADSPFSKNFLLVTPNIIVLDRIKNDFTGNKIFFEDPILPDNGYEGQNWQDDFQIVVHLQDEVGAISSTGNIFLTNIHRVYQGDLLEASFSDEDTTDYFLGQKPVGKTNESKTDLGEIIRNVEELMVLNDEAHHISDETVWLKSIQDIANQLKLKGKQLSLQIDVTATPKNEKGILFPHVVCDYPLVEAIHQNVVKHPVLPDQASRAKLEEKQTSKFVEKFADFLDLGYLEWKKSYEEHVKTGKKAILFVMTDDTKNCDDVANHLASKYPEFSGGKVLTIHTNKSGEISESQARKDKDELDKLRRLSNEIDRMDSPYLAIVSVMMLKEGWDVRNVTTIVGLRAFVSKSNILPEQTLGRGLRLMYFGQGVEEYVSVIGTPAFMDFVESIRSEGVSIETRKMDRESRAIAPIIVEVDQNDKKDKGSLDIELPDLTPRISREFKNLSEMTSDMLSCKPVEYKKFTEEQTREIIFKKIGTGEVDHVTKLDTAGIIDYQSVVGFFTSGILRELRLVGGYDNLFGIIRDFVQSELFGKEIDLSDPVTIRNLSEPDARRTLEDTVKKAINNLTVVDSGDVEVRNYIRLSQAKPFVVNDQAYLVPRKSLFNKIVGDNRFELEVASFLDSCDDIVAFAKNNNAIGFKIDYQKADGSIANYIPDFFIKGDSKNIYILETKGREDVDDVLKIARLKQWCDDATKQQNKFKYHALYVKEEGWEKYKPKSFVQLIKTFPVK